MKLSNFHFGGIVNGATVLALFAVQKQINSNCYQDLAKKGGGGSRAFAHQIGPSPFGGEGGRPGWLGVGVEVGLGLALSCWAGEAGWGRLGWLGRRLEGA